jgi:hypothetical protein
MMIFFIADPENRNAYLPLSEAQLQARQGQTAPGQLVSQEISALHSGTGSQEILNLSPPPQVSHQTFAEASIGGQQQQGISQDTYLNLGQIPASSSSSAGAAGVQAALVSSPNTNVHEYGETVPGQFNSVDSYAAYQSQRGFNN